MNKEIRHQIYCKALEIFLEYKQPSSWYNGLCSSIYDALPALNLLESVPNPFAKMSKYPEINKHKPKNMYDEHFWFDWASIGTQKRIDILKQAIEETKP